MLKKCVTKNKINHAGKWLDTKQHLMVHPPHSHTLSATNFSNTLLPYKPSFVNIPLTRTTMLHQCIYQNCFITHSFIVSLGTEVNDIASKTSHTPLSVRLASECLGFVKYSVNMINGFIKRSLINLQQKKGKNQLRLPHAASSTRYTTHPLSRVLNSELIMCQRNFLVQHTNILHPVLLI